MAIQVLSQETIDKIAAGEVVERPSSVVKELVENAIDANATAITVEIKDGGISLIRITDNGCGMSKDEISLAFLRHSTSKITCADDLAAVSTLGFRGEALSSISAVSQVEVLTKTREAFAGVRYCVEGGIEKKLEEAGTPDGTTFLVRNLFYNTPARKKFLKTNVTEGNYIQDLIERLALSHPEISFKFISNNQMKLQTSGNRNVQDVIYQIYGREIAANLIPVQFESGEAQISGFIGKPVICRGNRQYENYFINGRYVRSAIISKAIEYGYKNYMMQHKYPFTALYVQFQGEQLDVNVHPTKMELRFSDGEQVYRLFCTVIENALRQMELIPDVQITQKRENPAEKVSGRPPEAFEKNRIRQQKDAQSLKNHIREAQGQKSAEPVQKQKKPHTGAGGQEDYGKRQGINAAPAGRTLMPMRNHVAGSDGIQLLEEIRRVSERIGTKAKQPQLVQEECKYEAEPEQSKQSEERSGDENRSKPSGSTDTSSPKQLNLFQEQIIERRIQEEVQIIGQVFDTYWILQFEDKMYIADQHAAHEKVLYERMMARLKEKEHTSQRLSPPLVVTLSAKEAELLERHRVEFEKIGYEVEAFGGKEYAINAIPDNLYNLKAKELFLEMLDSLADELGRAKPDLILEKIASMSCKAAIKGNQRISPAEAEELLRELMTLENPYNCPHGRPVLIAMSKYELEKKFKRIV